MSDLLNSSNLTVVIGAGIDDGSTANDQVECNHIRHVRFAFIRIQYRIYLANAKLPKWIDNQAGNRPPGAASRFAG